MKVKLLKQVNGLTPGQTVDVLENVGNYWKRVGVAEADKEKKEAKPTEKKQVSPTKKAVKNKSGKTIKGGK